MTNLRNFYIFSDPQQKPLLNSDSNTYEVYSSPIDLILSVIFQDIFEVKIVNMPENTVNFWQDAPKKVKKKIYPFIPEKNCS